MFLGFLPQCLIYVVTGEVIYGWPLLPCVYNNRITINVLYFSPEKVVSSCLLKLQRSLPNSMLCLDLPYYSFNLTCIGLPVPLM